MARDHVVRQGECLSQIGFDNGFFWQTLWDHPNNAELKQARRSPFVLQPGDKVHIPDKRVKQVTAAVDKVHSFKLRGVPARLRIIVRSAGVAMANQPFQLEIDDQIVTGTTDGNGLVSTYLPPNAQSATLTVGRGESKVEYTLALRQLIPDTDLRGLQARLSNLGHYLGPLDGKESEALAEAIRAFQRAHKLEETGKEGPELRDRIRKVHGC